MQCSSPDRGRTDGGHTSLRLVRLAMYSIGMHKKLHTITHTLRGRAMRLSTATYDVNDLSADVWAGVRLVGC